MKQKPPAPATGTVNTGRLYAEDDGSGKMRLMIKLSSGVVYLIVLQP